MRLVRLLVVDKCVLLHYKLVKYLALLCSINSALNNYKICISKDFKLIPENMKLQLTESTHQNYFRLFFHDVFLL